MIKLFKRLLHKSKLARWLLVAWWFIPLSAMGIVVIMCVERISFKDALAFWKDDVVTQYFF